MLAIGIPGLRILAISFLLSTVSTILSGYFQALGDATYSLVLTLSRQVILLIVFVKIFSAVGNLELVWSSYIFAELLTIPLAVFLYRKTKKKAADKLLTAQKERSALKEKIKEPLSAH